MTTPSTAIVLLNYNSLEYLKQFLPVLIQHTPKWANIYIIDNASTDESSEYVKSHFADIKWISLEKNLGFAGGYAEGLKQIKESYWVLLNTDIEVTENWLIPLINQLTNDELLAAVQPKVKSFLKKEYFEHSGAAGGFIDSLGYPFCRGRIFDKEEKDAAQYEKFIHCFWATGACMAIKKEAYDKAGGFDPRFFLHMEEIDLCWRMQRLGYKIGCEPKSTVYHVGGGSLPYESPTKFYYNFRNNLILLQKNLRWSLVFPMLFIRCGLDWIAAFRELISGKPKNTYAVGKAWLDYLLGIFKWRKDFNHKAYHSVIGKYNRSIIIDFFFLKRKEYSSLPHENFDSRR